MGIATPISHPVIPLAGVMRNAQCGELPLFAWTLGLSARGFRHMVQCYFPEWGDLGDLPDSWFAQQQARTPLRFHRLVVLLVHYRCGGTAAQEARWVARAVAAACCGSQALWQDLGLAGNDEVNALLHACFPRLAQKNTADADWKHFLLAEARRLAEQPPATADNLVPRQEKS